MVGGPSSEIAHAPRVIIADLVSVAVVDVHHVFDALLAAAHGHFPSQREASAQGVETRLGYVGRVSACLQRRPSSGRRLRGSPWRPSPAPPGSRHVIAKWKAAASGIHVVI